MLCVDVWTGAASDQTTAASANSVATTTPQNPAVITTVAGSRVAAISIDSFNSGADMSSSDTLNFIRDAHINSGRAYKATDSGAPGSVSVNFSFTMIVYEILADVAPSATSGPMYYPRKQFYPV
jgi:hypothetical protein